LADVSMTFPNAERRFSRAPLAPGHALPSPARAAFFVSLIGPSGCGEKPTHFFNIHRPDLLDAKAEPGGPACLIDGVRCKPVPSARVGYMLQKGPALLPWRTVARHNVILLRHGDFSTCLCVRAPRTGAAAAAPIYGLAGFFE